MQDAKDGEWELQQELKEELDRKEQEHRQLAEQLRRLEREDEEARSVKRRLEEEEPEGEGQEDGQGEPNAKRPRTIAPQLLTSEE